MLKSLLLIRSLHKKFKASFKTWASAEKGTESDWI